MRSVRLRGALIGLAVLTGSCTGDEQRPRSLVDESAARSPPVALEGVTGPVVATRVRAVAAKDLQDGVRAQSCVAAFGRSPSGLAVERIGVRGVSLTFLGPGGRNAQACDGVRDGWCGWATGRLESRRLDDPRLTLSCRTDEGLPVGFAWIEPGPDTGYVLVEERGVSESYAPAQGLPIRVTSTETDLESATARFEVSEHARDGRRLRAYVLEARVAG